MSFLLRRPQFTSPSTISRAFSTTRPSNLARLTLVGRLGMDAEVSTTGSGQTIVKYVIGTSYGPKDNRQTSWFRVASFPAEGSTQRDLMAGLEKGTLVYVEGDASMRVYEDSEGKKQSSLSVIQRNIEILRRPSKEGDASAAGEDLRQAAHA